MRLLDDVANTRDRQLVGRVLGWDGRGGCSLQAAGEEAGVTRERARQIYAVVVRTIRSRTLCPSLDEVLEFVDRRCNRAADDIQTEMQLKGLTRHCFRIQALVKTAEAFGRATEFVLETRHGSTFVVSDPGLVDAILKAALRSSSRYGVQTVSEICGAISLDRQSASDHLSSDSKTATEPPDASPSNRNRIAFCPILISAFAPVITDNGSPHFRSRQPQTVAALESN